jgi:xylulose-5-phosphate/fructose-6-phosphate phosphoketolase
MTAQSTPLTADLVRKLDAYWRAANYLSVGQIYLYDNPLLKKPLKRNHIKPRLLGHWGTTPGLNFVYVHLNRLIKTQDANVLYITLSPDESSQPARARVQEGRHDDHAL